MAGLLHSRKNLWAAAAAVILIAAAALVFFRFYFGSDEAAVKARLREVFAFVEKQPGSNLQSIGMAHTLGGFFTEDAEISILGEPNGVFVFSASGRNAIEGTYAVVRPMVSSLTISPDEIEVSFPGDSRTAATVKGSLMANGSSTRDVGFFREGRLFAAELVREDDGEWRFRSFRAEPVISFE